MANLGGLQGAGVYDTGSDPYFDGPIDRPSVPTIGTPGGTPTGTGTSWFGTGMAGGVPETGAPAATGAYDWSQWADAGSDGAFTPAPQVAGQAGSQGWQGGTFAAPTVDEFQQGSPGLQYRLDQARQGVEASAFARGTGMTGGTATAIGQRVGDQASSEYEKFFNQRLAAFTENANVGLANAGLANDSARIANQAGQFNATFGEQHDQNQFGNVFNLAQLGLQAAGQATTAAGNYGTNTAGLATGYGQNVSNLLTGQGNVQAAGSATQANIWSALPGSIAGVVNAGLAARAPTAPPAAPSTYYGKITK